MSSIIALMLPPSHNLIIYSISAGGRISIADLFTAGIIPGLLLALSLMVTAWWVAKRQGLRDRALSGISRALGGLLLNALPGLILVAIIFGGVRSGVFTASESSCIAVVYAAFITFLAYRTLDWNTFVVATMGAVRTSSMVLLVIGCAASFGWLLAYLHVPSTLVEAMKNASENPIVILLLLNLLLLSAGNLYGHVAADRDYHAHLPAGCTGLWH